MRAIILAIVGLPFALLPPAYATDRAGSSNRCARCCRCSTGTAACGFEDTVGATVLRRSRINACRPKLSSAVQDTAGPLARSPPGDRGERRMDQGPQFELRHLSESAACPGRDIAAIKSCLLKQTEARIAILADPNFDCLAANTTAGLLICADPDLAVAERGTQQRGRRPARQVEGRRRQEARSPNMRDGPANAIETAIWTTRTTCRWRSCRRPRAAWPTLSNRRPPRSPPPRAIPKLIFGPDLLSPYARCRCRRSMRRANPLG